MTRPGNPGARLYGSRGLVAQQAFVATMSLVPDQPRAERRRVLGRLVRPGEDPDAFDIEFWRSMTGEQRVESLWGMTLDAIAIKGGNPDDQPRLQKSVGRIIRP